MSSLGIYFGPKMIGIAESKGKILSNSIMISQADIVSSELEEKVSSETKIVGLLKDELAKNKIDTKEVALTLPGKDLVIRTFEMPVLSRQEMDSAVKFEAKKYIPFKIEDLIFDYQVQLDKISRKNIVLFVGVKKEILDKYDAVLSQLSLKYSNIEYAAFSVLRILKLANIDSKGLIAVINADDKAEDEVNFEVFENEFPLFSRDFILSEGPVESAEAAEADSGMITEKLKTEIRISLDYYNRKFANKKIEKIYLVLGPNSKLQVEAFIKDMGLAVQVLDVNKITGSAAPVSCSVLKGFGASLTKLIKVNLKINLFAAAEKAKKILASPALAAKEQVVSEGIKISPLWIILGILICGGVYAYGVSRIKPLETELAAVISQRTPVPGINPEQSFESLSNVSSDFKKKINALDGLINGQIYYNKIMDALAKLKPDGIWFTKVDLKKEMEGLRLNLTGLAYLGDNGKEFELIDKFLSDLKADAVLSKYFQDMNIDSREQDKFRRANVTRFAISGRFVRKGK